MAEPAFEPLPPQLQRQYEEFDLQALNRVNVQAWGDALRIYNDSYELLLSQQLDGKRYHKGGPLFFAGLCHAFHGNKAEALRFVLLAYIEDLLSKAGSEVNLAEAEAAARNLRQCGVEEGILGSIRTLVIQKKKEAVVIQDPHALLLEVFAPRDGIDTLPSYAQGFPGGFSKKSLELLNTPWVNRVFVGGNYRFPATLTEIKKAVLEARCDPILAIEFAMPEDMIHHHTLMLLHTCRHAIFDIGADGGHLMEIERLRDYQIQPLLVYQHFPDDLSPPGVSTMLRTIGYQTKPYHDLTRLRELVLEHLTSPGRLP